MRWIKGRVERPEDWGLHPLAVNSKVKVRAHQLPL